MNVVALRTLREFWEKHPQAEAPLREWYSVARHATWSTPQDVKRDFGGKVDFVADNRAIFDIGGNKYRLITFIAYKFAHMYVKFVGTHAEYDKIDAETVNGH